jgi:hypothetical protein
VVLFGLAARKRMVLDRAFSWGIKVTGCNNRVL